MGRLIETLGPFSEDGRICGLIQTFWESGGYKFFFLSFLSRSFFSWVST